jgi:NitT/TauT family transport system ATP-binding protein
VQDELLRIWTELKQTIVFVTHGIEESLLLADRVVVMTYRPGTEKKIVPVTLGRPRDEATPEFSTALRAVTQLVREEQRRHERDQQQT